MRLSEDSTELGMMPQWDERGVWRLTLERNGIQVEIISREHLLDPIECAAHTSESARMFGIKQGIVSDRTVMKTAIN